MTFVCMAPKVVVMKYLGKYYDCTLQISLNQFCINIKIKKMRANFSRIYNKSNLKEMQTTNQPHTLVIETFEFILDALKEAHSTNIAKRSKDDCYLTADEEHMILHITKLTAGMCICKIYA